VPYDRAPKRRIDIVTARFEGQSASASSTSTGVCSPTIEAVSHRPRLGVRVIT